MRFLVDTHVMLWWMRDDPRLSDTMITVMEDGRNEMLWSLASSWEIAVKISVGKLDLDRPTHRFFADLITEQKMQLLDVGHEHCVQLSSLPLHHRDPFDRMLVAQATVEKVPVLTADPKIGLYEVETIS